MAEHKNEWKICGTVKVGDRGQVVIPADAHKEGTRRKNNAGFRSPTA